MVQLNQNLVLISNYNWSLSTRRPALACFFAFLIFDPNDHFAKAIAFAWWPFSPIFKMVSFLENYLFFRAVFRIEQLQCLAETF